MCIKESSRRIEQAEVDLCNFLAERVPTVAVITEAISDRDFKSEVEKELYKAKNVVRVNSEEFAGEDFTVPVKGLTELVDLSMEILPEAQRNAFAAAQKVDLSQKVSRSNKIVATSATLAGATGATPIPFSDAIAIVPIQVGMLASVSITFGLKADEAFLKTLVASTITGAGASLAGRAIVSNLLKLIPGAGSLIGGAISATTAAIIICYSLFLAPVLS